MADNFLPGISFQDRNDPGGIYATCYEDLSQDDDSLSQLDFIEDFIGRTNRWPPDRFATRFFRPSDLDHELGVVLFGEVLDEPDGTGLGAKGGSKHARSSDIDSNKIRDVIVLGPPTDANAPLVDLFNDQIITLRQIVTQLNLPGAKEIGKRAQWVKCRSGSTEPFAISVNLPYKYSRPPKSDTPAKLQKRASDKDVGDSKSDQILLTSTYDPKKMSDFDPELDLRGTRLIQQPLYDQDSNLVPPWQAPFVFRKGALLLVEATLSVFHFVVGPQPSHLYQLNASRVKLLAPTPLEYQPPPTASSSSRKKLPASRSAMFDRMLKGDEGATSSNMNVNV